MQDETVDGRRVIDDPVLRDRLMELQGRVFALQFNGLRLLTASMRKQNPGIAGLIGKLQGCELNHRMAALAIDALGELGVLVGDGPHVRSRGSWQGRYMLDLGFIIGGGTAQIQKNIIAERGLGLPREPKLAKRGAADRRSRWISRSRKSNASCRTASRARWRRCRRSIGCGRRRTATSQSPATCGRGWSLSASRQCSSPKRTAGSAWRYW